jgi:hypothetical protein
MQLIKDLWNVVKAVLAVIKTLVSYVRAIILAVENLLEKLTAKKEVPAPIAKVEPTIGTEGTPKDVFGN